ncbi:MAG TPA: LysR substrate-binding domain-containing protein [Ramlibacter sp.]|nr:LysR substrate-binding domain-containing protein [Ramlibacter sp.]
MNLTIKQVRAFLAVAQRGSFTAAAARLHLTQSAVSVLISELEAVFGLRLFDRTTRLVQLTQAGREFLPVAQRVMVDLEGAVASSRELAAQQRGQVAIAATPLMSSVVLPRAIARYAQLQPGVTVVLHDTLAAQVVTKVRQGDVDFGIGTLERSAREITAERLMTDSLVLACAEGHPLASRRQIAWRALAGHPFIALTRDNSVGELIADALSAAGLDIRPAYEVSHLWTVVGMVDAGLGIAVLPSYARAISQLYRIHMIRLVDPAVRRDTSLMIRRGVGGSPAAQGFQAFLRTFFREWQGARREDGPAHAAG